MRRRGTSRQRQVPGEALVTFGPGAANKDRGFLLDRVEEGHYEKGAWVMDRVWSGDQTDYGLNFTGHPVILKVRLATYQK